MSGDPSARIQRARRAASSEVRATAERADRIEALMDRYWFGMTVDDAREILGLAGELSARQLRGRPRVLNAVMIAEHVAQRGSRGTGVQPLLERLAEYAPSFEQDVRETDDIDDLESAAVFAMLGARLRGEFAAAAKIGRYAQRRSGHLLSASDGAPTERVRPGQLAMQRGLTATLAGDFPLAMKLYDRAFSQAGEPPYRHFAGANAASNAAMLAAVDGYHDISISWERRAFGFDAPAGWADGPTYLGTVVARILRSADALDPAENAAALAGIDEDAGASELWPFVSAARGLSEATFGDPNVAYVQLRGASFEKSRDIDTDPIGDHVLLRAYCDVLVAMGEGGLVLRLAEEAGMPRRLLVPVARVHLLSGDAERAARASGQGQKRSDLALRDTTELGLILAAAQLRLGERSAAARLFRAFTSGDDRYRAAMAARLLPQDLADLTDLVGVDLDDGGFVPEPVRPIEMVTLTRAERRVMLLATEHLSAAQIAERTFTSVHTVRTHLKSVYRKLGVSSRAEAIRQAEYLGILS